MGAVDQIVGSGNGPVSPLPGNGMRAFLWMTQDQRFDACDFTGLQDLETLTAKRMEGVGDDGPSQKRVVRMCSSNGMSQCSKTNFSRQRAQKF